MSQELKNTYEALKISLAVMYRDHYSIVKDCKKITYSINIKALLSPYNYDTLLIFNAYLFGENKEHKIQITMAGIKTYSFEQFINLI